MLGALVLVVKGVLLRSALSPVVGGLVEVNHQGGGGIHSLLLVITKEGFTFVLVGLSKSLGEILCKALKSGVAHLGETCGACAEEGIRLLVRCGLFNQIVYSLEQELLLIGEGRFG